MDLETFDAMAGALAARGLATPQDAATERAALVAQLNGEEPPAPAGPADASAGFLGMPGQSQPSAAAAGQDHAAQVEKDPLWQGPASPNVYDFGVAPPLPKEGDPDTLKALQAQALKQELEFRTLFHQEGIPLGIGNRLGQLYNGACARESLTKVQIESGWQDCSVALRRLWQGDFEKNLKAVRMEVVRLDQAAPGLQVADRLLASGMANDPWVLNALLNLARAKGRAV